MYDGYYGLDDYLDQYDEWERHMAENDSQPVQCPRCGSYNPEPEGDGQYYCWLCEYQW